MEYFKGTEIERLGDDIVRACDWSAFMQDNDGKQHKFIAMGCVPPGLKSSWTPATGLFGRYYGYMDNSLLIYLLGIASPTHPIPVSSWYACQATYKRQSYDGKNIIVTTPPGLAFHYYPHCWLDTNGNLIINEFKNSTSFIGIRNTYTKEYLERCIELLKECGNNLVKVNKEIKDNWKGEEVFKI